MAFSVGLARLGNKTELYRKLLRQFAEQLPGQREVITEAIMAGNIEEVRNVAHSIKGASGNLGLTELETASEALELAARTENFSNVFRRIDALDEALQRFLEVMAPSAAQAPQG